MLNPHPIYKGKLQWILFETLKDLKALFNHCAYSSGFTLVSLLNSIYKQQEVEMNVMYCQQFSIYYQEPILGIQEQCLTLGEKSSYQTIHYAAASFMIKNGQLFKISYPTEGKRCERGIFLISLEKQVLYLNEYTRIVHLTRIFKSIHFCLNFTYLMLYSNSNLTFICR